MVDKCVSHLVHRSNGLTDGRWVVRQWRWSVVNEALAVYWAESLTLVLTSIQRTVKLKSKQRFRQNNARYVKTRQDKTMQ